MLNKIEMFKLFNKKNPMELLIDKCNTSKLLEKCKPIKVKKKITKEFITKICFESLIYRDPNKIYIIISDNPKNKDKVKDPWTKWDIVGANRKFNNKNKGKDE